MTLEREARFSLPVKLESQFTPWFTAPNVSEYRSVDILFPHSKEHPKDLGTIRKVIEFDLTTDAQINKHIMKKTINIRRFMNIGGRSVKYAESIEERFNYDSNIIGNSQMKGIRIKRRWITPRDGFDVHVTLVVNLSPSSTIYDIKSRRLQLYKCDYQKAFEYATNLEVEIELHHGRESDNIDTIIASVINEFHEMPQSTRLLEKIAGYLRLPPHIQREVGCGKAAIKQMLPGIKPLTHINVDKIQQCMADWVVMPKLDGECGLLYVSYVDNACYVILANRLLTYPLREISHLRECVCKVEVVGIAVKLIDLYVMNDSILTDQSFDFRMNSGYTQQLIDSIDADLTAVECVPLQNFNNAQLQSFMAEKENAAGEPKDGIILAQLGRPYDKQITLKYKTYDMNTIDFYLYEIDNLDEIEIWRKYTYDIPPRTKIVFDNVQSCKGYVDLSARTANTTPYYLMSGISDKLIGTMGFKEIVHRAYHGSYRAVEFQSTIDARVKIWHGPANLHGKVVELGPDPTNGHNWILHKIREDRAGDVEREQYFGNAIRVADMNYFLSYYPVTDVFTPISRRPATFGKPSTSEKKDVSTFELIAHQIMGVKVPIDLPVDQSGFALVISDDHALFDYRGASTVWLTEQLLTATHIIFERYRLETRTWLNVTRGHNYDQALREMQVRGVNLPVSGFSYVVWDLPITISRDYTTMLNMFIYVSSICKKGAFVYIRFLRADYLREQHANNALKNFMPLWLMESDFGMQYNSNWGTGYCTFFKQIETVVKEKKVNMQILGTDDMVDGWSWIRALRY